MEKELTLRERYDQINQLILETEPQRKRFEEAEETVKKKVRLHTICAAIMHAISKIHVTQYQHTCREFYELTISNKVELTLYHEEIKETEKEELQKIIDEYSPEKVRIVKIVEGNLNSATTKYPKIEIELV